jgi:membrane peptidoglycan carboxypeptidase
MTPTTNTSSMPPPPGRGRGRGPDDRKGLARQLRTRSALWWSRRVAFSAALVAVAMVSGLVFVLWQIPLPSGEPPLLQTTFMCSSEVPEDCNQENSIAQLTGGVDRVSVDYERIPAVFILALLATEDREFFAHSGVDPSAVLRAALASARNDELQQGGSTITQQYVKNAYLSAERTWERKLRELVLAVKLERELPKQEILERYLNTIYWGRGAYGVQAAARTYFGKDVEQLGLAESAYLAGIIRAPESADAHRPDDDPLREQQRRVAEDRRTTVLQAMVDLGWITAEQRDAVDDGGWDYVLPREDPNNYGRVAQPADGTEYFVDYVRRWLVDNGIFTDAEIYGGGLRVYTTVHMSDQAAAAEAIRSTLDRPDDPQASLVAINDAGGIQAMVGGFDFSTSQVNLATGAIGGGSGRQPGSSFKAITLAAAVEDGMSLDKTFNAPGRMKIPQAGGPDWDVGNYGDAGQGTLSVIDATRLSSNTAYAQMITQIGPSKVVDMARRLGITAEVPNVPSITLGAADVSVLDMTTAFSVFSHRGERVGPWPVTRVTDARGTLLWEAPVTRERVLDRAVADDVNWTLRQVVERGTATNARISQVAAGKTGTAENFRDAWFIGYTCRLTAGVWVGYAGDDTRYMNSVHGLEVTGGSFPARIWKKFMDESTKGLDDCDFQRSNTRATSSTTTDPDAAVITVPPSTSPPTAPPTTSPPTTTTVPPTTAPPPPPPTTTPTTVTGAEVPPPVPTTGPSTTSGPTTTADASTTSGASPRADSG